MSDPIDLFKLRIANPANQEGLRKAVEEYSQTSVSEFDEAIKKVNDKSNPIDDEELRKIAGMLIRIKMDLMKDKDDLKTKHYAFSNILDKHIFAPGNNQLYILEDELCPPDFYERPCKKREEGVVFEGDDGNKREEGVVFEGDDRKKRVMLGGKKHKTRKHKKKGKKKTMKKKGKKKTMKKKGKKKIKKRGKKKTMKKRGKKSRK